VGDGQAVLKYLAPYVHRVAMSDKRIVKVGDTHVTFSMTPSGTKCRITKRVTGKEFVRGFVQHVLNCLVGCLIRLLAKGIDFNGQSVTGGLKMTHQESYLAGQARMSLQVSLQVGAERSDISQASAVHR
jgi:hypothetical protein